MRYTVPIFTLLLSVTAGAAEIHVRPEGPIRTLAEAQREARKTKATVIVHHGTYYLPETLVFTAEDSGTEYRAAESGKVVLSGGSNLDLKWAPYKDGILQAKTPSGLTFDQLFVNGQRQRMARYPNYDASVRPYGGFAADAFSKDRAARWADPAGGFIHAIQSSMWGGYSYQITGKNDRGEVTYVGGWQDNRPRGMHKQYRFVEGIFEELDAPGEWFHNAKTGTLYFYPPADVDAKTAVIEVVRLRHLVEFNGAKQVTLRGFIFRHAARTFMDTKEPLLRSDWTIYRGGALLLKGAEDCAVADCEFDQLGGNAIFVSGHNRRITVRGCDIHDTGASAIAFVGEPQSVRDPLFDFQRRNSYASLDQTPGPKTEDYPADCLVEDCLIRRLGVVEKQATGVELSMARGITIRHCSIYDSPRSGINVSEGTFGGHVVEFCDVFDTVKETGDHGSFNSWGRDRYWSLNPGTPAAELPRLALLDVVQPNILRNNRWRCDHGWDVDLDDGSTNYQIYNNVFLCGGLKLREGYYRKVWNNIAVNNSLHPHVWYENSGDEVTHNIWMGAYRPAVMKVAKWGKEVDRNLFTTSDADRTKFAANGCDAMSLVNDPQFVDAAHGDYRVKDGSPALKLGFENFPMDQFGVQSPRLKAIARRPEIPVLKSGTATSRATKMVWLGAAIKDLEGEEYSAFGTAKEDGGIHLLAVPAGSPLAKAGLRAGDLIQCVNGKPLRTCGELMAAMKAAGDMPVTIAYFRDQAKQHATLRSAEPSSTNTHFVPDFKITPDDYTVLMAADGKNPEGLHAWINDHRRMQVKNWPLGGQTAWDVEVVEPGDYAVNVLFNHCVPGELKVTVSTGESKATGISKPVPKYDWRRFSLPETLRLAKGRQTLALSIAALEETSVGKIELLSIELIKPDVRDRLHRAALAMRSRADTDWFRQAGFGLMCHWTSQSMPRSGPQRSYAQAVRDFDVTTFADQVAQTRARFVTLTTSHAYMYFPAPLSALDRILPGRTAERDLVADLADALGQRGIRLILYYNLGSSSDPDWQRASGFWDTDTSKFWNNWTAVITEAGQRYRDRLAGWWFDDGTANYYYRSAPWKRLATTAKAGNPKRIICFNPWILPSATEFQDYFAGEGFANAEVGGWLKPGDHGRISGGPYEGLQASAALVMEGDWLHTKRDKEIGAPRQSAAQLAELLRRFATLENVPMLNCEIYQDGTLSPTTVQTIRAAAELAGQRQ